MWPRSMGSSGINKGYWTPKISLTKLLQIIFGLSRIEQFFPQFKRVTPLGGDLVALAKDSGKA